MKKKKIRIVYDPLLEVEKKEGFVSRRIGTKLFDVEKKFEGLPPSLKWLLTVVVGGFISGLVGLLITIYFDLKFESFAEVSELFRIQLILDIVIIAMLTIFIGLLIKEARS